VITQRIQVDLLRYQIFPLVALKAKIFRLRVLMMTESAIQIPHVRIMGRGKDFIGLDDSLLIVCMTRKALLLL
jgi:hypothetical protein